MLFYISLVFLFLTELCTPLKARRHLHRASPCNDTNDTSTNFNYPLSLPGIVLSNAITHNNNYSDFNNSCSQCFMGQPGEFQSTVFNMLANQTFTNYSKSNENCSQCFKGLDNQAHEETNKTKLVGCMCGLFTTQNPAAGDIPLRTKSFHNVTCHEVVPNDDACKKVCMFAALAHNELEPDNICSHLNHATNIVAYVESKICEDNNKWVFTGLASPSPACCDQGNAVTC